MTNVFKCVQRTLFTIDKEEDTPLHLIYTHRLYLSSSPTGMLPDLLISGVLVYSSHAEYTRYSCLYRTRREVRQVRAPPVPFDNGLYSITNVLRQQYMSYRGGTASIFAECRFIRESGSAVESCRDVLL